MSSFNFLQCPSPAAIPETAERTEQTEENIWNNLFSFYATADFKDLH